MNIKPMNEEWKHESCSNAICCSFRAIFKLGSLFSGRLLIVYFIHLCIMYGIAYMTSDRIDDFFPPLLFKYRILWNYTTSYTHRFMQKQIENFPKEFYFILAGLLDG